MVLRNLADIQPQCSIAAAGVMADDQGDIVVDFQSLAKLTDIATGVARGEGCRPDPVPDG